MAVKMIHHHGFTVSDVQSSLKFYRDTLGFEELRVSERKELPSYDVILGYENVHIITALLRHPVNEFILELIQYINPPSSPREQRNHYVGSSHCAYEVDDIDALYERLVAGGYGSINPPVDVVRGGVTVARAVYALDPDGISVELFEEFEDVVKK